MKKNSRRSPNALLLLSPIAMALSVGAPSAHAEKALGQYDGPPLSTLLGTGQDQTLAPIVITAARTPQPETDALPHTTVISAEDIRNSQAPDLPTLLQQQAGIQITRNGGPGQGASMFIRGTNSDESLVLIDGIPIRRQASFGGAALESILPDQIDHIEIVRGNVSAIYGSGAIGGVVQIFTRHGQRDPSYGVSVEVGSRGTYKGSVNVSGGTESVNYALTATRFHTDGFSAINTGQEPAANSNRNGDGNTSLSGKLDYRISQKNSIGIDFYFNDSKYTFDDPFGTPTDLNDGRSKNSVLSIYTRNQFTNSWLSTLTLSQNVERDDVYDVSVLGNSNSGYKSTSNLLQWNNQYKINQNWTAIGGIDLGRENADQNSASSFGSSSGSFSRSTVSEYAGINGKIGKNQLQLNLRHDQVGGSGSDNTGYLGYGYALTQEFKLIASASTAFNAPRPVQLYQPIFGNPNLKSERARSFEIGGQYAVNTNILRATYFDTRTHNQFGFDPVTFQAVNIDRAKNHGLEISASGKLADLSVHAGLTLQDPQNENTDQQLVRRSKVLGSLGVTKTIGLWKVGGDIAYTDSSPDIAGAPELGSYWLANFNVRYQLNKQTSLFGRIDNLFNRDYQTAYSYNQPSRGLFLGIDWQH